MHSGIFNFCPFSPKFLIFGKVASDIGTFSRQLLLWCVLVQPWVLNGYATCGGKQQFDLKVNCEDFTCYTVNTVYSVKQNLKNIWKQIFSKKKKVTTIVLKDITWSPVLLCCRRTVRPAANFPKTLRFLHQQNYRRSWIT